MASIGNILAVLKGLWTTGKHMLAGRAVTYQWPEQRLTVAERYRGLHVLRRHEDGLERCIGCSLCAAACPAFCIYVEGAENTNQARFSPGERYAKTYVIDELRCIYCGLCEEACPTGAIVLGHKYEHSDIARERFIYDKPKMLEPTPGAWTPERLKQAK